MSDKTIQILEKVLAATPDDHDTRLHLADLLHGMGRISDALGHLDRLCAAGVSEAHALAGRIHVDRQAYAQALPHFEAIPRPAPEDHLFWAKALVGTGDLAAAEAHYYHAIEADPALVDEALLEKIHGPAPVPVGAPSHAEAMASDTFMPERINETFADVGGMEDVKERLRLQIILPLQQPELAAQYGITGAGGLLMYGPPGCGKTHLARAAAGECGAAFFQVGLHDILDMWMGNSEKNLHALFEAARARSPSIVFLDEIDALGGKRGAHASNATRQVVNQLLTELDENRRHAKPVLVIGATNTPWHLDTAIKRSRRFDQVVFVPPPDAEARAQILDLCLAGKPVAKVDARKLTAKLRHYSGADIATIVDMATQEALQAALRSGKAEPITAAMLSTAIKKARPTTVEWLQTARDHAKYSNEAGVYDDVLAYLNR